jgi:tRNA1(Val) A37 N6-methylase TrmN6
VNAGPNAVSESTLLNGRVRLLQPREGYRVAMDPVMLAAAVPLGGPGRVARVLDAGVGSGAAALCLLARAGSGLTVTGLEQAPEAADLARRAAALNPFGEGLDVIEGDLFAPPAALRDAPPFDGVMTNPPYGVAGAGTAPPDPARAAAHVATRPLADWLAACLGLLRPKGSLVVIHRADQLDTLLQGLAGKAGAVEVIPLWPGPERDGHARPARRVIVRARRGLRGPATVHPGVVLHRSDGTATTEADAILRHGAALDEVMNRRPARPARGS